jgi:hypothetical protein
LESVTPRRRAVFAARDEIQRRLECRRNILDRHAPPHRREDARHEGASTFSRFAISETGRLETLFKNSKYSAANVLKSLSESGQQD